jgi:two-component system sensor kinase FixL
MTGIAATAAALNPASLPHLETPLSSSPAESAAAPCGHFDFLEGVTGPSAAAIRAHRWDTTSAGPPAHWPEALRSVLATMLAAVAPKLLLWGPDLITFHNDAYLDNLGSAFSDAIGRPFRTLRTDIWPTVGPLIEAAYSGSPQFLPNMRAVTRRYGYDEAAYVTLVYTPVRLEHGEIAGVLGEVYDTTPLLERSDRLEGENARLSEMFARSPVLMAFGSGPNLVIRHANPAFSAFFGNRPLLGLPAAAAIPEARQQGFFALIAGVYRTGEPWIEEEMRILVCNDPAAEPEVRFVDFLWQATRDEAGEINGVLCFGYDVTERRRERERADRLHAQLLHASRLNAMGTMAMTIAHEINQPLTAASNFLSAGQRFLAAGRDRDEIDHVLVESERQIQRAGEIIRRMRALVSTGSPQREEVSLAAAVARAAALLQASGEAGADRIGTRIPVDADLLLADPVQLDQILTNLLRNALQASTDASFVTVEAERCDGRIRVNVRDRGRGLVQIGHRLSLRARK